MMRELCVYIHTYIVYETFYLFRSCTRFVCRWDYVVVFAYTLLVYYYVRYFLVCHVHKICSCGLSVPKGTQNGVEPEEEDNEGRRNGSTVSDESRRIRHGRSSFVDLLLLLLL